MITSFFLLFSEERGVEKFVNIDCHNENVPSSRRSMSPIVICEEGWYAINLKFINNLYILIHQFFKINFWQI